MSIKYALVYFFDSSVAGPTESEYQEWVDFETAAKDAGQLVHGTGLFPSTDGKCVSIRDGQADGTRIAYERLGNGPALILVSGGLTDWDDVVVPR